MPTTDKSKRSTSNGDLTVRIPDPQLKLAVSLVKTTLRDLYDNDQQIQWDAAYFFVSDQHIMWCQIIGVDHEHLKKAVGCVLREKGARRRRMVGDLVTKLKQIFEEN